MMLNLHLQSSTQILECLDNIGSQVFLGFQENPEDYDLYATEIANRLIACCNVTDYEHSSSEELAKNLNISEFYSDYKLPGFMSRSMFTKHLSILAIYNVMSWICGENKPPNIDTTLGDPQVLAKQWLSNNTHILKLLNFLNDCLIDNNPTLCGIDRFKDNWNAEFDFTAGILYRRNPEDINYFLQRNYTDKILQKEFNNDKAKSYAYGHLTSTILTNIFRPDVSDRPICLYWIISPDTMLKVFHKLNIHIDLAEALKLGTELFPHVAYDKFNKIYFPEALRDRISSLISTSIKPIVSISNESMMSI